MVNAHACRLVGNTSATGGTTAKTVSRCSELMRGGVVLRINTLRNRKHVVYHTTEGDTTVFVSL